MIRFYFCATLYLLFFSWAAAGAGESSATIEPTTNVAKGSIGSEKPDSSKNPSMVSASTQSTSQSSGSKIRWELNAEAAADSLWYTVSTGASLPPDEARTFIRYRQMHGNDLHDLTNFPSRIINLGHDSGKLLVLLPDGEWRIISDRTFQSGNRLRTGEVYALSGFEGDIYVVGIGIAAVPLQDALAAQPVKVPTTTTAATTSSSTPSKPITTTGKTGTLTLTPSKPAKILAPTTRPDQLQLYRFVGSTLALIGPLPAEVTASGSRDISINIVKGAPTIAYRFSDQLVKIIQLDAAHEQWVDLGMISIPQKIRKLKLLSAHDRLIVWILGETGAGSFFFDDSSNHLTPPKWREQTLAIETKLPVEDVSAAATKDQLHLLVLRQDEEILEQKYDLAGVLDRDSIKSVSHTSNDDTTVAQLLQYGVLIALIVVSLVVATGSGPVLIVPFKNVDFAVAPMSLRLAAALIDLFPLYIWRLIITWRYQRGLKLSELYSDPFTRTSFLLATVIYCLVSLIGELKFGKTIGKHAMGLKVVGTDGKPATINGIVLRNLLRVIELCPLFTNSAILLPLLFLPLVPMFNLLRHRLGDLAAGTTVVVAEPKETRRLEDFEDDL